MKKLHGNDLRRFMYMALNHARSGSNNNDRLDRPPYVGSVIINDDLQVLGRGRRRVLDGTERTVHAERDAIYNSFSLDNPDALKGATIFTTLEPCVKKWGSTMSHLHESCCELIVERGVARVVYGLRDTSTLMRGGKGVDELKRNGVEVVHYKGFRNEILLVCMDEKTKREHRFSLDDVPLVSVPYGREQQSLIASA